MRKTAKKSNKTNHNLFSICTKSYFIHILFLFMLLLNNTHLFILIFILSFCKVVLKIQTIYFVWECLFSFFSSLFGVNYWVASLKNNLQIIADFYCVFSFFIGFWVGILYRWRRLVLFYLNFSLLNRAPSSDNYTKIIGKVPGASIPLQSIKSPHKSSFKSPLQKAQQKTSLIECSPIQRSSISSTPFRMKMKNSETRKNLLFTWDSEGFIYS